MATEKRLIDANALAKEIDFEYDLGYGEILTDPRRFADMVEDAPTVDAVEVAHGRWEDFCRGKICCCSVCKAEFDNTCNEIHGEWKFCPNCGAKMDGDGNG